MKFQFEYKPYALKKYIVENFAKVNLLPYPDYESEVFKSNLDRLISQVDTKIHASVEEFDQWINSLEGKYKQILPFVYEKFQTKAQQLSASQVIRKAVSEQKIVFAHLLQECYSKNKFNPYWSLLADAYRENPKMYNKFWTEEIKKVWQEYASVKENHVAFVGDKILASVNNMDTVLNHYFIREDHEIYKEIFLYIFEHGTIELYRREERRFRQTLESADTLTVKRMVTGFVRADALNEFEDISYIIFDTLNTYVNKPLNWQGIDQDVKEKFHRWYLRKDIKNFFSGISTSHQRFIYWEKFIPRMEDAIILTDKITILFYFKDVLIMEILDIGAVYVYEKSVFYQHFGHHIDSYRAGFESNYYKRYNISPYRLERKMFMKKPLVYKGGWLIHTGDWQHTFDLYIKRALNWEV